MGAQSRSSQPARGADGRLSNVARAINILLSAHGASSFAESNLFQRIWRDSAVAARHAVTLPAVDYERYGKALLRRDDQITCLSDITRAGQRCPLSPGQVSSRAQPWSKQCPTENA